MRKIQIINTFVGTLLLLTLSINCSLTASKFSRNYSPKLFVEDTNTKLETLMEISLMGPEAAVATSDLIKLFRQDRNPEVRRMAIEALGAIKADLGNKEVNYTFLLAMNDEDTYVRYAAIGIIEELRVIPVNFIPYLQKHLADSDPLVRDITMRTFQKLERLGVRTLIGALKYPDMRLCATVTLGRLGKADRLNENDCCDAIRKLEEIQQNDGEDGELSKAVAEALKDISKVEISTEEVSTEEISTAELYKDDTSKEDTPTEEISKKDIPEEIIPEEIKSK